MASSSADKDDSRNNSDEKNEELFTIEASVVTGFEECARGEAREKFEADVKAARGKITWKIPPSRLPEVLKMKSIDNCRVVMLTMPHFKFTDQNESLARIQKMILDVDWESGLKAWNQLFHFPHPIASRPDSIPSPEDLVDVVVMTRLPQPKDKSEKKKKNQRKGKGKKKDNDKRQNENEKKEKQDVGQKEVLSVDTRNAENLEESSVIQTSQKSSDDPGTPENLTKLDTHLGGGDCVDMKLEKSDRDFGELQSEETDPKSPNDVKGVKSVRSESGSESSSDQFKAEDVRNKIPHSSDGVNDTNVTVSSETAADVETVTKDQVEDSAADLAKETKSEELASSDKETEEGREESKSLCVAAPKTVVVKKLTSADKLPKIDIKVIQPETVFPTALGSEELRHLEPMEVDSPNASFNLKSTPLSLKNREEKQVSKVGTENDMKSNDGTQSESLVDNVDFKTLSSSPTNLAAAFATSVIKRLSSSPTSPTRDCQAMGSCTTPPPTPIASMENPFISSTSSPVVQSTETEAPILASPNHMSNGDGSSVDPVPHKSDTILTDTLPALQPTELSETQLPTSSVTEESLDQKERPIPTSLLNVEACKENHKAADYVDKEATEERPVPLTPSITKTNEEKQEVLDIAHEETAAKKTPRPAPDPTKPKFRVTCNRVGEHPFDSSSAAASFGSAVITYLNWPVDLKKFDIEVLLNIDNEEVSVSIALTKTSLHNRNMVAFGPTTLRPTICYNMLRLCRIRNGDFICDPMCGTSAIPIESALNWTNCFTFGGDCHEKAIERTAANMAAIDQAQRENKKSQLKLDAVQWNINNFPLKDSCVDVFVSDLPFGHRLGCRTVNRTLYPSLLSEMARTARPGARACLLTEDRTNLIKAIQTYGKLWQRRLVLSINIGGLSGFVFVLIRTTAAIQKAACGAVTAPVGNPTEGNANSLPQVLPDSPIKQLEQLKLDSPVKQNEPVNSNLPVEENSPVNSDSPVKQIDSTVEESK